MYLTRYLKSKVYNCCSPSVFDLRVSAAVELYRILSCTKLESCDDVDVIKC